MCGTHQRRRDETCAAWPKLSLSEQEGPDPVPPSLRYLSLPSQGFPGARAGWGRKPAEVEERERKGWSSVGELAPGTRENGVSSRLPTPVNPHVPLTFSPDPSPGYGGDQRAAPKAGVQRWVEGGPLRCWECARTLGWSLLEVGPVLRCKLGFEGYQASGSSFPGNFLFPPPWNTCPHCPSSLSSFLL